MQAHGCSNPIYTYIHDAMNPNSIIGYRRSVQNHSAQNHSECLWPTQIQYKHEANRTLSPPLALEEVWKPIVNESICVLLKSPSLKMWCYTILIPWLVCEEKCKNMHNKVSVSKLLYSSLHDAMETHVPWSLALTVAVRSGVKKNYESKRLCATEMHYINAVIEPYFHWLLTIAVRRGVKNPVFVGEMHCCTDMKNALNERWRWKQLVKSKACYYRTTISLWSLVTAVSWSVNKYLYVGQRN